MPSADVTALLTGIEDLAGSLRDGMAHVSSMENAGAVAARVLDKSYREQALLESGEISRLFFGLHDLDTMTGGLYKEELTVVAGRPSMGKSAVALWMALHQARQRYGSRLFQCGDEQRAKCDATAFDDQRSQCG